MVTDKPIDHVTDTDLRQLIADSVMEGKRIEYKRALDLNPKEGAKGVEKEEGKRKFLASIASFANASGGDMYFGIEAKDGKPVSIAPLADFNPDATKLRLQDLIRSHIEPRLFGVEFHEVAVQDGLAFIVRIAKSYNGPHMVTFGGDDHFYMRGANGRARMDLAEIRTAFTFSETIIDRVRKWRMERIANILADETPLILTRPAKIIMHVMPLCAFSSLFKADILSIVRDEVSLRPINASWSMVSLDFDGAFVHNGTYDDPKPTAYTYAFRNGCIEGCDTTLLSSYSEKKIAGEVSEYRLMEFLERSVQVLKKLDCEPPFFVALSLLNVRGFTMHTDHTLRSITNTLISRDHLFAPEAFVESYDFAASEVLRESFYMIWNACGRQRSPNYTDNNKLRTLQDLQNR